MTQGNPPSLFGNKPPANTEKTRLFVSTLIEAMEHLENNLLSGYLRTRIDGNIDGEIEISISHLGFLIKEIIREGDAGRPVLIRIYTEKSLVIKFSFDGGVPRVKNAIAIAQARSGMDISVGADSIKIRCALLHRDVMSLYNISREELVLQLLASIFK